MAEELKRHGLTFSLDLNKHPKDATNLSLINAENFKISEDGASLISDKSLLDNKTINEKLNAYFNRHISSGDIKWEIVGAIPSNDEIVLFVTCNLYFNENEELYYQNDSIFRGDISELNINNVYKFLQIFRYNEKLNIIKNILEYENKVNLNPSFIYHLTSFKYYGGKFSGTFTYNAKNELIIAFCEYDSVLKTELECGEPMKIINLGYWENEDLINESNLNPKTFAICPEVIIPEIVNDKIIPGYSKKGWYHFYIRYKINQYDYTQWFDFGKSFYLDDIKFDNIFDYSAKLVETNKLDMENNPITIDVNRRIVINDFTSNDLDFCNKTIKFELNNLDSKYKHYQIGCVCSTKLYTECKISYDININNKLYILEYSKFNNYDINNLINSYNNYYNVKNIINYNNRLYISNYKTFNSNINIKNYINCTLNSEILKHEAYSFIEILFKTNDLYETITKKLNYKSKYNINEIFNKEVGIISVNPTKHEKTFYNINDVYNFYKNNNYVYISLKYRINNQWGEVYINNFSEQYSQYKLGDYFTIYYYNETINQSNYIITDSKLVSDTITTKSTAVYKNKDGKYYYRDHNNTPFIPKRIYPSYDIKSFIKNDIKDLNDIKYSLIPDIPYFFYIHYVNKYGEITNGINIDFNFKSDHTDVIIKYNDDFLILYGGVFKNDEHVENTFYYYSAKLDCINIDNGLITWNNDAVYVVTINDGEYNIEPVSNTNYINSPDYNLIGKIPNYIYNTNKSYSFGEIAHLLGLGIYNNIYINKLGEIGYIIHSNENFELFNLNININEIPKDYVSYFISYEKLDNLNFQNGVSPLIIKNFNIDNNELYNENLNYKDSITLDYDYCKIYTINDLPLSFDSQNTLYAYQQLVNLGNSEIKNIKKLTYIVNNENPNNIGKNTNIKFELEDKIQYDENDDNLYIVLYLNKIISNINNNKNKILIRCSEITNSFSVSINTYSHLDYESAIIVNNKGYRIDSNYLIRDHENKHYYLADDNGERNDNFMLINIIYPSINNNFAISKSINNKPKIYNTLANTVSYQNKNATFIQNKIINSIDLIDLYKNNSLDYNDSVLSIYTNYDKDNINQTDFIKTIRRSTYIKDESLENGWRTFESEAYQNIQENKGEITRIEGIGDLLLVHTKDSLFQFDKSNLLMTANKNVQLAQGDTFDVGYKEIFTSKNGFGGLQDKEAAIVGEFGYIWYNNDFNKIYQYNAGSLNVISGNIEFLLNKYKPTKCRFVDDKYNKRLLIQFQLNNNNNQVLNLTYNYDIKAFISFYINENSENNLINETYNTKTKFYILENNKIFSEFDAPNAKKLSFIINENYTKIKRFNYIKYKLYKRIDSSNNNFNADLPVEGNALSLIDERRPYSGYKLKVYNDLCSTEELNIQVDLKSENNIDIKKPYYDLGNFTFNYLRDKETNSQIFGNFFIVEFTFEDNQKDIIEFESLEYGISYEEN